MKRKDVGTVGVIATILNIVILVCCYWPAMKIDSMAMIAMMLLL
jgi:hypothetical protein